jgi:serpin B
MRAPIVLSGLLTLGLLHGCGTTKTGNPSASDAPEGMVFLHSTLEREAAPTLGQDAQRSFGRANRDFAFALYEKVRDEESNLFFSPYSISTALAMTFAGARGTTQSEMAAALRFELPGDDLHSAFNATEAALAKRENELIQTGLPGEPAQGQGFALELTNALFAQRDRKFADPFLDLLARHYGGGVYLADFFKQPERERVAINDWVSDRTMQRIPELLPAGSLRSDVAFVLVNSIYFKANWLQKFDAKRTAPAQFQAPGGDVTVQMMHGYAEQYARLADYQALELQYLSPAVRVLFILPDAGKLGAVEAQLSGALFEQTLAALSRHSVDLQLPRFRFDAEFKLKEVLEDLGMPSAFAAGQADLSGMSGRPGELYLDQVYHDAFVAMNEEGTEAAAATAVVGVDVSAPPPAEFIADRPFLFLIHDEPTGQILFAGRVTTPKE